MAGREIRAAPRRLLLLTASVAVGVAALVAINSFTDNLRDSVRGQARALLGADLALHEPAATPTGGRRPCSIPSPPAAAGWPGSPASPAWRTCPAPAAPAWSRWPPSRAAIPFTAPIRTEPAAAWRELQRGRRVVVDPSLLTALDARVGDTLSLGEARFAITGTVVSAPGQRGVPSRVRPPDLHFRRRSPGDPAAGVRRPGGVRGVRAAAATASPRRWRTATAPVLSRAGPASAPWPRTRDPERRARPAHRLPRTGRAHRAAARRHRGGERGRGLHPPAARHHRGAPLPRCDRRPGARGLPLEAAAMGAGRQRRRRGPGRAGAAAAAGAPGRTAAGGRRRRCLAPRRRARASASGLWVALVFALLPLLASGGSAARGAAARRRAERRRRSIAWRLVALAALAASTVGWRRSRSGAGAREAIFAAGVAVALLVLWGASWALIRAARRWLPGGWPYVWRQGIANLHRPANQTVDRRARHRLRRLPVGHPVPGAVQPAPHSSG